MVITFYKKLDNDNVRYYSLHDRQGDLFSPYVLTSIWGGELDSGRAKVYTFSSSMDFDKKLRQIFQQRIKSGYKVLYSFSRKKQYKDMFEALEKASS